MKPLIVGFEFLFMCSGEPTCLCAHYTYVQCPQNPEEDVGSWN